MIGPVKSKINTHYMTHRILPGKLGPEYLYFL